MTGLCHRQPSNKGLRAEAELTLGTISEVKDDTFTKRVCRGVTFTRARVFHSLSTEREEHTEKIFEH